MLRATVRQLADDKIAPRAAEVDETAEFPHDVYAALVAADLHAIHIPEEYEGMGGDALAACNIKTQARIRWSTRSRSGNTRWNSSRRACSRWPLPAGS